MHAPQIAISSRAGDRRTVPLGSSDVKDACLGGEGNVERVSPVEVIRGVIEHIGEKAV
jgi:hypothetical protein